MSLSLQKVNKSLTISSCLLAPIYFMKNRKKKKGRRKTFLFLLCVFILSIKIIFYYYKSHQFSLGYSSMAVKIYYECHIHSFSLLTLTLALAYSQTLLQCDHLKVARMCANLYRNHMIFVTYFIAYFQALFYLYFQRLY